MNAVIEKEKKYIDERNVNILKKYNHILKIYEKNDNLLIYSKYYFLILGIKTNIKIKIKLLVEAFLINWKQIW